MDIGLEQLEIFKRLGVALAVGFLIGLERGWSEREQPEGSRIAGIRTFGLIALLGALWSLLAEHAHGWMLVLAFLGFAGLVVAAQWLHARQQGSYGMTTAVAALITFALGAMAALGYLNVAAATAVVVALILGLKTRLHGWLRRLDERELFATLKLLLISVVLLPVLPDRGYGPWQALNPYEIWWMVVLVAGISYCGYFASQIAGPRRGVLLTALAGGLVSSTAVTLTLARLQRAADHRFDPLYAAGIILASATMFPRVLVWVAVIRPELLAGLAWPLGLMIAAAVITGLLAWRDLRPRDATQQTPYTPRNPFELGMALQIGAVLAAVMLLARALTEWFGAAGVYLLAGLSGIADVDAITLTLSRMAGQALELTVAVVAITIATMANTLTKGLLAGGIGGAPLGRYVLLRLGGILVAGLVGLILHLS